MDNIVADGLSRVFALNTINMPATLTAEGDQSTDTITDITNNDNNDEDNDSDDTMSYQKQQLITVATFTIRRLTIIMDELTVYRLYHKRKFYLFQKWEYLRKGG